jgi:penicillin-binding protein 1C
VRLLGVLRAIFKWLFLSLLSAFIFFVILEIFYPINLAKAKDISSVVVDRDNRWVYATLNSQDMWRFSVDVKRLDPLYKKMLLNYEDKRFYSHFGVDFLALIRASWQLLTRGKIKSGASTITMQLARLLEPKSRTFGSKIIEIFRSFQLELHYTKEQILSAYLTLAPYGGNVEGIVGASMRYFGKLPYSLTPSECALLASIPQNPEKNRVDLYKKRAIKARDIVLKRALDFGVINSNIYAIAKSADVSSFAYSFPRNAPHLSQKLLRSKSKRVSSTIYLPLQEVLQSWVKGAASSLPSGATISVVVARNRDSSVVAYIGSHDIFSKKVAGYIDMASAVRSPGSVLKPLIYAMGFKRHIIDTNTIIKDKQSQFGQYRPNNFNNKFNGEVTVARALKSSLNIPALKVLQKIGAQNFIDTLELASSKVVVPKNRATLPVALGGLGVKLTQVLELYIKIANGGKGRALSYLKGVKGKEVAILDASSLRKVTNILRELSAPSGYTNKNGFFAYKTGTSYGYRDFWSAIYSKEYTAVVLVCKPDNTPIIKSSARKIAAKFAFDVMGYVKVMLPHSSWSEDSKLTTSMKAPAIIKELEPSKLVGSSFSFMYPKNNSKYQSASCQDVIVNFKLKDGQKPYNWYIDGKLNNNKSKQAKIKFGAGAHEIGVIDSNGAQIYRDIWVYAPECD